MTESIDSIVDERSRTNNQFFEKRNSAGPDPQNLSKDEKLQFIKTKTAEIY